MSVKGKVKVKVKGKGKGKGKVKVKGKLGISGEIWSPHPGPQTEFLSRGEDEVLYGGARAGGKSECLLMASLRYVSKPKYRGIIFRRTFPELQELLDRTRSRFNRIIPGAVFRSSESRWIFPSGSVLRFAHMQDESSKYNYLGHEYQFMGFDELTHFTETQYKFVSGSCRTTDKSIPAQIRATSNPGNIGHEWVKRHFIDPAPAGEVITDKRTGMTRCFIAATVYDNPTITVNDPLYIKRLEALPWREREMMLYGNWDVFAGQAFPEWNRETHVVKPFKVPSGWMRFIAIDWGYSKPFAVLWFAVDPYDKLYIYKEWYGVAFDEYNEVKGDVGVQMSAFDVAQGVRQRCENERIDYVVIDVRTMGKYGHSSGSIAEEFERVLLGAGIDVIPAGGGPDSRVNGKNQLHTRLRVGPDGRPGLMVFSTCLQFIRTFPMLPVDELKPEDVNSRSEDHCLAGETEVITSGGLVPIRDLVGTTGEVLTTNGLWTTYWDCRKTRLNQQLVKVTFADGRVIRCTADHKFLTDAGWKEAADLPGLTCHDVVQSNLGDQGSRVISVILDGSADVYCLVADNTHAFAVCGGIVVSNCYDAARYGCMSRPMSEVILSTEQGSVNVANVESFRLKNFNPMARRQARLCETYH